MNDSRSASPLPQEPPREKLYVEGMANLTSLVVYLRSQKVPEHWIEALFAYGDEIERLRAELEDMADSRNRFMAEADSLHLSKLREEGHIQ